MTRGWKSERIKYIALISILCFCLGAGLIPWGNYSGPALASQLGPEQIILSWTDDPSSTQTITWLMSDNIAAQLQYMPAAAFSGGFAAASVVEVQGRAFDSNNYRYQANISGLTPDTHYVYRVGSDGAWSDTLSFRTAADTNEFTFMYLGDIQEGYADWENLLDSINKSHPQIKFSLVGGDLSNNSTDENEWGQFLDAASPYFSQIPFMPTLGNHDGLMYLNFFALPANGPEGLKQEFYSFDYGNAHFVVLNSGNNTNEAAKQWLQADLQSSTKTWKFAMFHHPAYPALEDNKTVDESICENWVPILEANGVDMVFVGHQHQYMRTYPIYQGQIQVDSDSYGIVYVMGNAGTKVYAPGEDFPYIARKEAGSNYQLIDIDGDSMSMTSIKASGELIETYTIDKSLGEISISVSGDGVSNPSIFSEADLLAMEQVQAQYSTINTWPSKKMYVASGVRLADLLEQAGITDEARIIKVKSRDGYIMTFTLKELLTDTRCFYPGLKENHEHFGYINGSSAEALPVPTILALQSAESTDFAHMTDIEAPLLVMGQRWVSEQTNQVFAKYVNAIEVSTVQPDKWENPSFTPTGGAVAVGTQVELSTLDMDGDNIYYTIDGSDPGYQSNIYNWIKKRWWTSRPDELAVINHAIEIKNNMTIKAVAIGFGKLDSDIVAFDYQVPQPPGLTADSSEGEVGQSIDISFVDDPDWRISISDILVNEQSISGKYTVEAGIIKIDAQVFTRAGVYEIRVLAPGYAQASISQTITAQVVLQTPAIDQEFIRGQQLYIQGTALGLLNLSLKIVDPEGVVIYGPSPLTVLDGIFNSSFNLSSTARTGTYTMVLDSDSLLAPISTSFKVKTSSGGGPLPPVEDIILTISGDGVSGTKTFTLSQLEKMNQYQEVYSVINTWPTKKWCVGQGVKISTLLDLAGIKSSARLIKITSEDGYTTTLTLDELLHDNRYCFPGFKEGGGDADGHIPGSPAGKRPVEPMIALISAEGTDNSSYMNDLNSPLFMMGQRAVTEQVGNLFVKRVSEIQVLSTSPSTWDSPEADPGSGEVEAGTMVRLSNKNMDDDKIYYTTDGSTPTLDSPMYNWIASRWWGSRDDELDSINHPIEINKDTTIKALTIGPGKKDSKVVTFNYKVKQAPNNTAGKIISSRDSTISLGREAKLEIPANALAQSGEVVVTISKVDLPLAVPKGVRLLSSVFELKVDGKNSYRFADKVSLNLSFDPAELNEGDTPCIYYFDEALDQWINLGGIVSGSTITVQIDHVAKFTIMARDNTPGASLSDIIGHWAQENIQHLLGTKVIGGYPDGSFKPDKAISRAEFVTILVKVFPMDSQEGQAFMDTADHWAREYIATAVGNGVVSGYNENSFGPDDLLTREQMAVMIYNASQISGLTDEMQFTDKYQISIWAKEALAALVGHGIINGYPDNSIKPQGKASRAEAVTVIVNTLKLTE